MARKPKIKLTEPQYAFLCELVKGPQPAVETFRPASKLVEVGFATRVKTSFNWEHTITEGRPCPLQICPHGRQDLRALRKGAVDVQGVHSEDL